MPISISIQAQIIQYVKSIHIKAVKHRKTQCLQENSLHPSIFTNSDLSRHIQHFTELNPFYIHPRRMQFHLETLDSCRLQTRALKNTVGLQPGRNARVNLALLKRQQLGTRCPKALASLFVDTQRRCCSIRPWRETGAFLTRTINPQHFTCFQQDSVCFTHLC